MTTELTIQQIDELNQTAWEELISNPKKGLDLSLKAFTESDRLLYKAGKAAAALNIGWCYSYLSESKQALEYLQTSLELYTKMNDLNGCMKTQNAIGVVYHNLSQYESALEYYAKSLAVSKSVGNKERELVAINNLGEFYLEIGSNNQALDCFSLSLELAEELKDEERLANVLVNMAIINKEQGEYTTAKKYLERASEYCSLVNDQITSVKCYTAMGLLYDEMGRYDEAAHWLFRSIEISRETGNRLGELEAQFDLAKLFSQTGREKESLELLLESLALSKEIESKYYTFRIHQVIAELYEKEGNFEKSLGHYKKYYDGEKLVFSEESKERLEKMITRHEIERSTKEAEIYKLKNIELKIVGEIGQKITASLDMETIMFTVYENVNQLMPAESFGVAIYNSEKEEIDYRFFIENTERLPRSIHEIDPDKSFASWCIVNKKEVFLNDNKKEYKRYLKSRAKHIGKVGESIIYIPLMIKNEVIGALTVQSFSKNAFTDHHLEIFKALGSYLAAALENSLVHEKIRQLNLLLIQDKKELEEANHKIAYMANHDNLTSLPNRRLIGGIIEEVIPHSKRNNKKFALFYIDLDNFKPINDNYGHAVGDEVLKIVAGRLLHEFRESDTVARIGGDEFVAIIRDIDNLAGIESVAGKALKGLKSPVNALGQTCTLSISIGISIFPADGTTFEELLKKADRAMYLVKETGKDGYRFFKNK